MLKTVNFIERGSLLNTIKLLVLMMSNVFVSLLLS